jgi:hypothetical protein
MAEHRAPGDAVQHFGEIGAHARSLAGGKHDGQQISAHDGPLELAGENPGCTL